MSNDPQSARSFCTVKVLFFHSPAQILEVGIGKADGRTNRNVTMTTHARTGKPDIAKLFSPETKFGIAGEGGWRAKCLKLVGSVCVVEQTFRERPMLRI